MPLGAFGQDVALLPLEIRLDVVEDRDTFGLPQGWSLASWQDRRKDVISSVRSTVQQIVNYTFRIVSGVLREKEACIS